MQSVKRGAVTSVMDRVNERVISLFRMIDLKKGREAAEHLKSNKLYFPH